MSFCFFVCVHFISISTPIMRALEARQISIEGYLSLEGISPLKRTKGGQELWYSSPIREGDENPSFKVDISKNLWFDFGISRGGNVLDLVCELQNSTISEALAILDKTGLYSGSTNMSHLALKQIQTQLNESIAFKKNAGEKEKNSGIKLDDVSDAFEIMEVSKIENLELLQFLKERNIDFKIAQTYLKQIHYKPKGKVHSYYALVWACGDGFEARSPQFKGFIGCHKDIIRVNLKNNQSVSIFEGFFDYLAFLTHYKITEFQNSVIILNSINLKKRALSCLDQFDFNKVYLFLDNDKGGQETKDFFIETIKKIPVIDKSILYKGYNDFNAMLIKVENHE